MPVRAKTKTQMTSFAQSYDTTIQKLDDSLSLLIDLGAAFDLETNGDVLSVIFEDGSKFIISPNSPVNQLWVSANYEGHRFNLDPSSGVWVDEKSKEDFSSYIRRILSSKLGKVVDLSI